ncbi:MAG: ATP-cone protein [Nitrososphaeraceae archaeon]|nr:ATP-cone protein [Nitrososphaeraceae archaeon]
MKSKKSDNNNNSTKRNKTSKAHRDNATNTTKAVKRRPRVGKTQPLEKNKQKQQITVRRSSGRKEKFDTNRMAQTVSRSGVPFLMARDVAKKVSGKIKQEARNQQSKGKDNNNNNSNKSNPTQLKEKTVTGSRVRKLVASELRDRNRSDIAESYSGQVPENTLQEQNLKDQQPIADTVAANRNRVLHDTSKRGGGIMT